MDPADRADGAYMERKANETFDNELLEYMRKDPVWAWYLDQRLFGLRFHRWRETHKKWVEVNTRKVVVVCK